MKPGGRNMDDFLHSLDGIERVEAPVTLYRKIEQKLDAIKVNIQLVPARKIYLAAASVILLVLVNIIAMSYRSKPIKDNDNDIQQLVQYYGLSESAIL